MPATAATTAPLLRVFKSCDEILVIARLVVVACVVVALSAVKLPKVEDALVRMPAVKLWSWLKVLAVVVPKAVVKTPVDELYASG